MDFFDLIRARESCRNFDERPVEREKLIQCLEAARIAPSACNSQPWSFVVVEGELARKLAPCVQGGGMNRFTDKAPAFIVVLQEHATLSSRLKGTDDQTFASLDVGLATAHLVLAATDQGLSTCILGWLNEKMISDLLGISSGQRVKLVVAVGYAAADTVLRTKKRRELDDIVRWA
jgi:nitroreductase